MPHWVPPSHSLDCSSLTWAPYLMVSQSSSDSSVDYATHVSDTMCQSFDCSLPNIPLGEAHLFKFMLINPDLWLCVRVSIGILNPNEWYYSWVNDKWFGHYQLQCGRMLLCCLALSLIVPLLSLILSLVNPSLPDFVSDESWWLHGCLPFMKWWPYSFSSFLCWFFCPL